MRGPKSLSLPLCQMTPSARLPELLQTNRKKGLRLPHSLTSRFWGCIQVKIKVIKLDFQTAPLVWLAIVGMCGLSRSVVSTHADEATSEGPTNPRTWASEHTSSLRHWAILTNGSKWKVTVKVTITRYVDYKHCHRAKLGFLAKWRLWLSDLTSLSPCKSLTSTNTCFISNTSVQRPLLPSLNSNCANLYTMHCDVIVYLIQSKTCYAINFQVDQTVQLFPSLCESWEPLLYFLSTSKGMSQFLCQHWAPEYVWRVSLTQGSYHRPF